MAEQHNFPTTPTTALNLPVDDAHADAMKKWAEAIEDANKAASSPGARSMLTNFGKQLGSVQVALRSLNLRSAESVRGLQKQEQASRLATKAFTDQQRVLTAVAARTGDATRGVARDLLAVGVAARVLGTGTNAVVDAIRKQSAAAQDAGRAFLGAADARKAEASAARGSGDRAIGRAQSRQQRERTAGVKDDTRAARIAANSYAKTIASQDRGESPGADVKGVGSMKQTYAAAGADARKAMAEEAADRGKNALEALAKRRAMRATKPDKETGDSGHELYYRQQHSRFEEQEQLAKTSHLEATEMARVELGGEGAPGEGNRLFGEDRAKQLQARQGAAYDALAKAKLADEVLQTQRVLEMRRRIEAHENSPEGLAMLKRKADLEQQIAADAMRAESASAQRAALRANSPEGQAAAQQSLEHQGKQGVESLEEQIRKQQELERYYKSPAGAQQAQAQARAQKELERSSRAAERAQVSARWGGGRLGGAAAYANDMAKGWERSNEQLRSMASLGDRAFAVIASGMIASASLADPFITAPTLLESFKSVLIEIGAVAKPVVDDLSGGLQRTSAFIRNLSDGTKEWSVRLAIWIGAGGLMISTLYKMALAARAFTMAVGGVNAALATGGMMLAVGAAAALTAEYAAMGDKASYAARGIAELNGAALLTRAARSENTITPQDLARLPPDVQVRMREAGSDRNKMIDTLLEFQKKAQEDLDKGRPNQMGGLGDAARRDERFNTAMADFYKRRSDEQATRNAARIAGAANPDGNGTALEQYGNRFGRFLHRAGTGLTIPYGQEEEFGLHERHLDPEQMRRRVHREAGEQARPLTAEALEILRKAGIRTFDDARMRPDEVERRRALGEFPESEVRARVTQSLETRDRSFAGGLTSRANNAEFLRLEQQRRLAEEMVKKTGGDTKFAERWPGQAGIMDPQAFADRLQVDVLRNGDDLTMDNMRRQLEVAEGTWETLKQINENLMKQAVGGAAPERDVVRPRWR